MFKGLPESSSFLGKPAHKQSFRSPDVFMTPGTYFIYSGVRLSFYTYYISPIEIELLWAKITYLKTHSKAVGFGFQTGVK